MSFRGDNCIDVLDQKTTWTGKVGLMYPSDYCYATSCGSTTDRTICLNTSLSEWDSSDVSDCKNNDWLFNSFNKWTISPYADSFSATDVFHLDSEGYIYSSPASDFDFVQPVVYLTSNVKISSGTGSESDPFELSL